MRISTPAFDALLARAPYDYRYLAGIARDGWAWEYLRRNPTYVQDAARSTVEQRPAQGWHLDAYYDPTVASDKALTLWMPQSSGFVLPVSAAAAHAHRLSKPLILANLNCQLSVLEIQPGCQHVVFLDRGQRLQISVSGASIYEPVSLSPLGAGSATGVTRRTDLRRALDHLLAEGQLPVRIHRPTSGAHRLLSILLALDFTRAGLAPREIAEVLFGPARVNNDWQRGGRALQAQVARAIARGNWLSEKGYLTLLR